MKKCYELAKKIYGVILSLIKDICGTEFAKVFDTRVRFHRIINLKNPQTLSEKVCWLEVHGNSELVIRCSDKWEVREYVKEKGLSDILVPVYGDVYQRSSDIPFAMLPQSFVIKATHGCKMNYFCKDKDALDMKECIGTIDKWLKTTYGTYSGEWHYTKIPHRIYVEKYLDDADKMIDYKFHCFNGNPEFVLVVSSRDATSSNSMRATLDLFDMGWNKVKGLVSHHGEIVGNGGVKHPSNLPEMIAIAKKLSEDLPFVRVDLYELHGKIYFSELTFTPACGVLPYFTDSFNRSWGKKLKL